MEEEGTEMEMEAEESQSQPKSQSCDNVNSIKRFGLKNSIQTNFGDDYVFEIVPKYCFSLSLSSCQRSILIPKKQKTKIDFFHELSFLNCLEFDVYLLIRGQGMTGH